jgi:hypothetical protein
MMSLLPQIERELLDAAQRTNQAPVAAAGAPRPPGRRKRRSPRRGVLASLAGVGAGTIVALLLLGFTGGSGTRAISIAAAAYRAASPGPGILYVVTETTQTNASGQPTGSPSRVESWSTTSPDAEHSIQITGSHVFEQAITGHDQSVWTSGRPGVITTTTLPMVIGHPVDPASMLRGLYRAGRVSVAGHSDIDGRPVLRLHIASPPPRAGILTPGMTVLVDAKTFAPIELISYDTEQGRRGGPYTVLATTVTRYLTFQHLPATNANRDRLRIADHPHARVIPKAPGNRSLSSP